MNLILETDRLSIRQLTLTDAPFIVELVNTPGWLRFIGDRDIKTNEQAENYLTNGPMASYTQNGFGLFGVELKSEKTLIGMCGLIKRKTLPNPDIGFAFLPGWMGIGFAFEAANAVMALATNTLKLPTVLAITLPDNQPSRKLLEKIGLKFVRIFSSPDKEELMLYSN
ncbi:MAG: GNAT family N-acetyltransferase [Rudanella sp.]|nr:GNAT family N-acetyltransferase [Rudanella sp.]